MSMLLSASLWGSFASCAPVCYRRNWRVANPPQDTILPHTDVYFSAGPRKCCGTMVAKPSTIFTGLETSLT